MSRAYNRALGFTLVLVSAASGLTAFMVSRRISPPPVCRQYAAIQDLLRLDAPSPWLGMLDDGETLVLHFPRIAFEVWPDSVRYEGGAYAGTVPVSIRRRVRP